jgi:hypothetical protein
MSSARSEAAKAHWADPEKRTMRFDRIRLRRRLRFLRQRLPQYRGGDGERWCLDEIARLEEALR